MSKKKQIAIAWAGLLFLIIAAVVLVANDKKTATAPLGNKEKSANSPITSNSPEKSFKRPSRIKTTTDELTNTKQHLLTIRASTGEDSVMIGGKTSLNIRCNAQGFDAYIITPTYNAGFLNDNRAVALRWDDGEVRNESWNQGSSGLTDGYFASDASGFLSNLIKAKKLAFAWTPYGEQQRSVRFDLVDHKPDLEEIQKLCTGNP